VHLLHDLDDPRRRLLIRLLAAGTAVSLPIARALADVLGEAPGKLPADRSVYRLSGEVSVNGKPANLKTRIGNGDTIETGKASEIVFVNVDTAYILRASSRLDLTQQKQGNVFVNALRLLTEAAHRLSSSQTAAGVHHDCNDRCPRHRCVSGIRSRPDLLLYLLRNHRHQREQRQAEHEDGEIPAPRRSGIRPCQGQGGQ
jgi:hypothetical protein